MIRSFADRDTARLWARERVKRFESIERAARKTLRRLNAAVQLNDLMNPPGNLLESLQGIRAGQYSIRINDQWCVCFLWRDGHAYEVEIVDYHR
ncbi:MAG: hypothetical protein FKY71_13115 [Spiribacter salinus]|uniref:Type II toxin-antitoxin system RelE/ParE family toxin n=1 Tax=Spiribacter salinus TaxID=1335746 RepID=A0A540VQZ2_9GAMM|nr:MAG: hypothetical protein FKY71_13115 [Spiribacter salinus]